MPVLTTRIHGLLDYAVGLLLIVAPYVLGFATGGPQQWVPMALGAGAIAYSLLTRYEFGAVMLIPMRAHLWLDIASGVLLASSPWLLGFSEAVYWPHLTIGLVEIAVAGLTQSAPAARIEHAWQRR
jgi:hypothetical protein